MTHEEKEALARQLLPHVSASQIVSYRSCQRQWYNKSILKLPSPPGVSQETGIGVHKQLELYLGTGRPFQDEPQLGITVEMLRAAEPFLPPPENRKPGVDILIEHKFEIPTYEGGPTLIGYIDLVEGFRPLTKIVDYKTTSDTRYMKTPAELRADVQLLVYARWLFSEILEEQEKVLEVQHLYIRTTKPPKSLPVVAQLTRADVQREWGYIVNTIAEMVDWVIAHPETADALPPNTDICNKYRRRDGTGGCAYKPQCGFAPAVDLVQVTTKPLTIGGITMSLADRLIEKKKLEAANGTNGTNGAVAITAVPAVVQAAPPAAAPAPAAAPTVAKPSALSAMLGLKVVAPAAAAPAAAASAVSTPEDPFKLGTPTPSEATFTCPRCEWITALPSDSAEGNAIIATHYKIGCSPKTTPAASPPASPALSTAAVAAPGQALSTASGTATLPPEGSLTASILPPDAPGRTTTDEEAAKLQEAAGKRGRGRPKKSPETTATATASPPPAASASTPAAAASPAVSDAGATEGSLTPVVAPATVTVVTQALRPALTLCIGVYPIKNTGEKPVFLEDWLVPVLEACAESSQVEDVRVLGYKAKDLVATAIRQQIKMFPPPAVLIINEKSFGASEAIEVLTPHATMIYQRI